MRGLSRAGRPSDSIEFPEGGYLSQVQSHFNQQAARKGGGTLKFGTTRRTHVIINETGEMRELEDNWCQVGPLMLDQEWTGWAELTFVEEGEKTEDAKLTPRVPPPLSAAVKIGSPKRWMVK